jgi:uncharacterized membrane protein
MRRQDIENLSNLVFGLVLSLVALVLISNPPKNPKEMMQDILWFVFSFMIVMSVWKSYVGIVAEIEDWGSRDMLLNLLLLLFVGLEPYFFNSITFQNYLLPPAELDTMNNAGTTAYALDIAFILFILASYYHIISKEHSDDEKKKRRYRRKRNLRTLNGALFAVSALPFMWTVKMDGMELRYIFWFLPLVMLFFDIAMLALKRGNEDDQI